jgi:hypothetical protein
MRASVSPRLDVLAVISVNASYPQNPWGQTGPSEQDGGWTGAATIDPDHAGRLWNIKVWAFCATVT